MNQMRAATEAARRRMSPSRAYSSTHEFRGWLGKVTPQWTWDWPHQLYIYRALNRVTRGECKRLMILAPPRHTKTETVSVRYSSFRIEREPSMRVILGAYNQPLANKISRKARRIVGARVSLSRDLKSVEDWETSEEGGLRAVGVGSGVTGYGANLIIIEDPVKSRKEANSKAYRDRCFDWYTDDLYTRLEPDGAIILIMTPWHSDDLRGRLLEEQANGGEEWEVVRLPALAEENDPLGREVGEALCPERFDEDALRRIERNMGAQSFSALYQCLPVPSEGLIFKAEWFKHIVPRAPKNLRWVRYWDLAASLKTKADYTCSAAVAFGHDGKLYIKDMIHGRWEWPDARRLIIKTMKEEPHTRHGVEEALHGLAAVQELRRERSIVNVSLRGVRVTKDKLSRALPWADRAENGKGVLVQGPWIKSFINEATLFTGENDAHDDRIDSISGGVEMLARSGGGRIHAW